MLAIHAQRTALTLPPCVFGCAQGVLVQLTSTEEQIWLPRTAMRQERPTKPPPNFSPGEGSLVEVQVIEGDDGSDDEPFWRVAELRRGALPTQLRPHRHTLSVSEVTVRPDPPLLCVAAGAERGGLYFVRFGGPRGTRHDSVEKRRVRPSYGLSPAVPAFDRREIQLPTALGSAVLTPNNAEVCAHHSPPPLATHDLVYSALYWTLRGGDLPLSGTAHMHAPPAQLAPPHLLPPLLLLFGGCRAKARARTRRRRSAAVRWRQLRRR